MKKSPARTCRVLALAILAAATAFPPGAAAAEKKSWWFNRLREPKAAEETAADAAPAATETAADEKPAEPTPAPSPEAEAATAAAALTAQETTPTGKQTAIPKSLHDAIQGLRISPIALEPNVTDYLDAAERNALTAAQLNDFAVFLGKRGLLRVGREFQKLALHKESGNPTLWINLGTLELGLDDPGAARDAFQRASRLDPGNAVARYNIGAAYDAEGNYDNAVEYYRQALALDPTLADPKRNPQVVNNDKILAVNLMLYRSRAGALGLPLIPMQRNAAPPPAPGPSR